MEDMKYTLYGRRFPSDAIIHVATGSFVREKLRYRMT